MTDRHRREICREEDPERVVAVGISGPALLANAEAKPARRRCPVVIGCLTWSSGAWGGPSEDERRARNRLEPDADPSHT